MSELTKNLIAKIIVLFKAGCSNEEIAEIVGVSIEEVKKYKVTEVPKGSDLGKYVQAEHNKLKSQTFSVDKLAEDLIRQIKQSQDISNEVFQQMQNCLNVLKTSKDAAEIDRVATTVRALNHITTGTKNLSDMLEKVRNSPHVLELSKKIDGELYFDSAETIFERDERKKSQQEAQAIIEQLRV